jgi:hypothetical protein
MSAGCGGIADWSKHLLVTVKAEDVGFLTLMASMAVQAIQT